MPALVGGGDDGGGAYMYEDLKKTARIFNKAVFHE